MKKIMLIIRQTALLSLIPQFLFMGLLILIFYLLKLSNPFFYGAISYLFISFSVRGILTKEHNKGIKLVRENKFTTAIEHYKRSVNFFDKNTWIDKYRYLFLLSSSKFSYKEMGMINIAFCYYQLGDIKKAKEMYENTLKEFPESEMAKASINIINSSKEND